MGRILPTIVLLGVSLAACTPTSDPVATEKLRVAEQMIEAWNNQNWEGVYALFAEDGVLHSVMKDPVVGRETIRRHMQYIEEGVDQIELNIVNMGVINDVVFIERLDEFVFEGREGSVPVVGVMEIADGYVTQWREYYDLATLEAAVKGE